MYQINKTEQFPLSPKCYTEDFDFMHFNYNTEVGTFGTYIFIGSLDLRHKPEKDKIELLQGLMYELSVPFAKLIVYDALRLLGASRDLLSNTETKIINFSTDELYDNGLDEDNLSLWHRELILLSKMYIKKASGELVPLMIKSEFELQNGQKLKNDTRITFWYNRHLNEFVDLLLEHQNTKEWDDANLILNGINDLSNEELL